MLSGTLGFGLTRTTMVMTTVLACLLVIQYRARRYVPALYWPLIVLVSIVGTLITDNLTELFDVPLPASTTVFALLLAATLGLGHARHAPAGEDFYWPAVLFTFALGTAVGDLAADELGLGYGVAALGFAVLVAGIWAAHRHLGLPAVAAFWGAYVLLRPLGIALGDLLAQPADAGGLGAGPFLTSALFLAVIVAVVAHLSATRVRHHRDAPASNTETRSSC
ncbi:membrane protein [Actinoplanes sp. L3-i22]|nr:membrane protein [Actinoplanes sp. L3-i22]